MRCFVLPPASPMVSKNRWGRASKYSEGQGVGVRGETWWAREREREKEGKEDDEEKKAMV